MMFTAKDLHNKIQESNECQGIDFWVENSLVKGFKQNPSNVTISVIVLQVNGWTKTGFELSMKERGFHVKLVSDQRDGDYYSITYPPQSL